MANTVVHADNVVTQWHKKAFRETLSRNKFLPFIGKKHTSSIQLVTDLTKGAGDNVTVSYIAQLTNAPVTGDDALHGNAENLDNFAKNIVVDRYANAVEMGEHEARKPMIDLLNTRGDALLDWDAELARDQIITALGSPNLDGKTAYASCTEAEKNLWVAAQYAQDRVLFGAAISNYSASDHATSLANVDAAADTLSPAIVSLLKRLVRRKVSGKYRLAPIKEEMNEGYVLLCPSVAFRDFSNAAATLNALQYAGVRGEGNALFTGDDLVWDGIRIIEIPEIETITGVGAATIDVAPCYLLGACAAGWAMAEETNVEAENFDYGRVKGLAVMRTSGVDKLIYDNTQIGVATLYVSGVADT